MLRQSVSVVTGAMQVDVVKGTAQRFVYTDAGGGVYTPPTACNNTLKMVGSDFVETQPNGMDPDKLLKP